MFILLPATGRLGKEGNMFLLMLFAIALFIGCTFASCQEIRYTLTGKTQIAAVDKMYQITHRDDTDGSDDRVQADYIIDDAGTKRKETDTVDMAWFQAHETALVDYDDKGTPKTVTIQYLSGSEGSSRLAGHTHRWVLIPFLLVLALLAFSSIRFMHDFNAHQRRMARERD